MKYIRTKDGIYEVHHEDDAWFCAIDKNTPNAYLLVFKEDVIKQADTIEELCDGFVITSKQGHIYDAYGNYDYELKKLLPQVRKDYPDEDWDLYGCILIDGIIKQVAKMNEKGELELL